LKQNAVLLIREYLSVVVDPSLYNGKIMGNMKASYTHMKKRERLDLGMAPLKLKRSSLTSGYLILETLVKLCISNIRISSFPGYTLRVGLILYAPRRLKVILKDITEKGVLRKY
jgi:hypothetical protein